MITGFDTTDILLLHRAGEDCLLPEGFEYWWRGHKYRHRPTGHTDGMSSPQFTHVFGAADPYGWALPAAVPHDGGYHDALEIWIEPKPDPATPHSALPAPHWSPITLDKDTCDQMFYDLLVVLANGHEKKLIEARAFYEAVHLGGQSAFNKGRGITA